MNSTMNNTILTDPYDTNPLFEELDSTIESNTSVMNINDLPGAKDPLNDELERQEIETKILEKRLKNLKLKREIENLEKTENSRSKSSHSSAATPLKKPNEIRRTLAFDQLKAKKSLILNKNTKEQTKITLELARNGNKVPKFEKNGSLFQFLTQELYLFILDQGLTMVESCLPFIHHAFSKFNMRHRLSSLIDEILEHEENIELLDFLILLGKKLSPRAEKINPDKHKRKTDECCQDATYRLLSLALASDYPEDVVCSLIASILVDYESNAAIKTEISREILRIENSMNPKNLISAARAVDRILKLDEITEFSGKNDDLLNVAVLNRNFCKICKKNPVGNNRSGVPYSTCYDCRADRKVGFVATRICVNCKQPHQDRSRVTNDLFASCKKCYFEKLDFSSNHNSTRREIPALPRQNPNGFSHLKSFSQVSQDQDNQNLSFSVYSPNEPDLAVAIQDNYSLGNERLKIKFESSNGLVAEGLCDTGANGNVIEMSLLEKYGLDRLVEKPQTIAFAHGFDGKPVQILGTIILPLITGNKSFSSKFDVVNKLSRYAAILGTPYLKEVGVMAEINKKLNENKIEVSAGN